MGLRRAVPSWLPYLLSVYFVVLLLTASRIPLWLDEIIQLIGTRDLAPVPLLRYIATTAGQTPVGNFLQSALIHVFSYSLLTSRIESILSSIAACVGIYVLTRKYGQKLAAFCVFLFALLPMQFRYAMEARPYAMALCLAVWLLVTGNALCSGEVSHDSVFGRRLRLAAVYAALLIVGIYTQPYIVSVAIAQLIWCCWTYGFLSRTALILALAVALSITLFLPWYLYAKGFWHTSIVGGGLAFHWQAKTPLMIIRELSGGGFLVSVPLIAAVVAGFRSQMITKADRTLWLIIATVPIVFVLSADSSFGYFLASRQWIFALPGMVLLGSAGIINFYTRRPHLRTASIAATLALLLYADARYVFKPHEDWQTASALLAGSTQEDACTILPDAYTRYFRFFQPTTDLTLCSDEQLKRAHTVRVVADPYKGSEQVDVVIARLGRRGFRETSTLGTNLPKIYQFEQPK